MSSRQCVGKIEQWISEGAVGKTFFCANPHSLVLSNYDYVFEKALKSADLLTPDGVGIVFASRALGGKIRERVTGSDIFWSLSNLLNGTGGRSYFFLGSTKKTLTAIREKMAKDYPHIIFAGHHSPSFAPDFDEEENAATIDIINSAAPDVLWVGMTAPKQEKWIYSNRERLNVKFIGAIGAVFDFYAGNVKRSSPFFQRIGLEWLPRFLQEPRRLFRRNFVSSPLFVYMIVEELFKKLK